MRSATITALLAGLVLALGVPAAHASTPFGLTCTVDADHGGVRECVGTTPDPPLPSPPGTSGLPPAPSPPTIPPPKDTRVPSFDDTPLDVNVVLPPASMGDTGLPLMTLMHGYGGKKYAPTAAGGESAQIGSMASYAERGYAVLSFSARGFGESCGSAASRTAALALAPSVAQACQKGWIHLDDMRFEARDAQWLMGLLVDQHFADPQRLGVTGVSYGGITSTQLAALKDRMWVFPDGGEPDTAKLVPFKSPAGVPMRIAAAGPSIPGSDLAYSLVPNGRTTDFQVLDRKDDIVPAGVPKLSYVTGFYGTGNTTGGGYYAPPGADKHSDITQWYARIGAGDPYEEPVAQGILEEINRWHSGFALLSADAPSLEAPAPTLFGNGFTDDLFPVDEAMRFVNKAQALFPGTPMSTFFFDYGHARGQNKDDDLAKLRTAYAAWFDFYVKGGGPQPFGGATALTQTCPKTAASGGPFAAGTYDALHPGEVRQRFAPSITFGSTGGDPRLGQAIDPIAGSGACATTDAADQSAPTAATYRLGKVAAPYTLLGAPTVIAKITKTDTMNAQIAARLWDVGTDGKQTLVARTLYRPDGAGKTEVFQLHANGYRFATGHVPKLELLGSDAPYGRQPSGGAFTIAVSDLELRLPVREAPDCTQVLSHAPPFLAGKALAPGIAINGTPPCGEVVPAGAPGTGGAPPAGGTPPPAGGTPQSGPPLTQTSTGAGGDHGSVNGKPVTSNGQPVTKPVTKPIPKPVPTPAAGAARHRVSLQMRCSRGRPVMTLTGADRGKVRRVAFSVGAGRAVTDRRGPFAAGVSLAAARHRVRLKAVVTFKDGAHRTVTVRAHPCRPPARRRA
jgi:hypothetical protein